MQALSAIDDFYKRADPWGYQEHPDDAIRKDTILSILKDPMITGRESFEVALDIGAGEGWITKDLPAARIYGIETSDNAAARFPENVRRIKEPREKYDLITVTGMMYSHYNFHTFIKWVERSANGIVLLCNIQEWEVPIVRENRIKWNQIHEETFPYREYNQQLRVYDFTA